ncbi:class I SAM-dependent methyltransferase [Actinacidiphila alni]|uniref:class I SAM-dependent methyltransferase n=1 Tax=Actinacidiphila alni TaxID=380248 RepID=UPI003454830F
MSSPSGPAYADAWSRYVAARQGERAPERAHWDWYQRYGPGVEVLGPLAGLTVADLGSGTGRLAAMVARTAGRVWAVDSSEAATRAGRDRFGGAPGLTFVREDAVDFLTRRPSGSIDVAYSAFGAADFTAPDRLLPAVAHALRPGGTLVLATLGHFHSGEPPYEEVRPATIGTGRTALQRWVLAVPVWERLLTGCGFTGVAARVIQDPGPGGRPAVVTVLVRARRGG